MKRLVFVLWLLAVPLWAQTQISGSAVQIGGNSTPDATYVTADGTGTPPSNYQILTAGTGVGITPNAAAHKITVSVNGGFLSPFVADGPIAGQYMVVSPSSSTITASCPTGTGDGYRADADNSSASLSLVRSSTSSCVGRNTVTFNFTVPSSIPIANITDVYPFIISSGSATGGGNWTLSCSGAGISTPSASQTGVTFATFYSPQQRYVSSTSLSPINTTNFNAMQCTAWVDSGVDPGIGMPNGGTQEVPQVGAYVYYTGTPVTQASLLYAAYPLQYNSVNSLLSFDPAYNFVNDISATTNTLIGSDSAFTNQYQSGIDVSICTPHATTSTTPTFNLNGWGAWTIVGPTGGALSSGDIGACSTGYLAHVTLGPNFQWWLQNPLVSGWCNPPTRSR